MAEGAEDGYMKNITFGELLKLGDGWNKNKTKWHNHYLTPKCVLNDRKPLFKIVVENEDTEDIFVCISKNHKLEDVEKLEKLVYKNIKAFQAR